MEHHFKVEEAIKHGIGKAVLIYNLKFWLGKNKEKGKNIHEINNKKYYWTFNSTSAFSEIFPYFTQSSIKRWLVQLEQKGVILSGSFNRRKNDRTKWYTMPEYLVMEKEPMLVQIEPTLDQNDPTLPDNKQIINTDNTDVVKNNDLVCIEDGQLPIGRGKTKIERVMSVYIDLFKDKYSITPFNNKITTINKEINSLSKCYTELQISAMLISFFNWAGMSGDDNFSRQKLTDAVHPFGWFYSTINQYEVYLKNVFGLKFDDEYEVREFVKKYLLDLKK